jgi:hypothetical protein
MLPHTGIRKKNTSPFPKQDNKSKYQHISRVFYCMVYMMCIHSNHTKEICLNENGATAFVSVFFFFLILFPFASASSAPKIYRWIEVYAPRGQRRSLPFVKARRQNISEGRKERRPRNERVPRAKIGHCRNACSRDAIF